MQINEPVRISREKIVTVGNVPKIKWRVSRLADLSIIAEGVGTTEKEAQDELRTSLQTYGLTDEEINVLMGGQSDWQV